ncbi:GPR1/FUN34/yaaH family-domain-containing protein [Zychaea mexicana]|uniref:GPR1/FUN34/yaaH family-domain-containing protein n=1 Tax=Zychaea mexicana TaxID=64656 RepID=UPI0022FE8492|nr:GPR1/FUN34/yaaH family-domain-containing protein [Zychaea mexicana]KAI9492191.1 GPR1/FUN34/yaaH family-domain-containing protein [Zychaea mexicana]
MSPQKAEVEHHEGSIVLDVEKSAGSSHSHQHAEPFCNVPEHAKKVSNPMAIGFGAFALGAFLVGITNAGIVTELPQGVLGVALGFSGMGQFVCGIFEMVAGNTFAATTMLTYAGFWISYGVMFSSGAGFMTAVTAAGEEGMHELHHVIGLWQIAFAVPSLVFFIGTFKQPWIIRLVLLQVFLTFFFGGLGGLTGVAGLTKAGAWVSFTLSLTAWYVMTAILWAEEKVMNLPFF